MKLNTKCGRMSLRLAALMLTTVATVSMMAADSTESFKNEIQISINRGLAWLKSNQNSNGSWSMPDLPAMTAFGLLCFKGDPTGKYARNEPEFIKKGYQFLLSNIQPGGGIHNSNYVTYNTAISMLALAAANNPSYEAPLRKARQFLVGLQTDMGEPGKLDSPFDGGIGYGSHYMHSDMGNTSMALEAFYYTRHLAVDTKSGEKDLNYAAAIHFLQNCQNLPSVNKQEWVSDDPKDKGGFIYYPGHSMAGGATNAATGKVSLRSYGSISYAGFLSYTYAQLKQDDPRVKAVLDWLCANYSLDENPGMGPQGLFFYYHTMTKALAVGKIGQLQLSNGKTVSWQNDIAMRLINLQNRDGSWANDNNRWMEKDPVLVTAYALLSLEMIHRSL